MANGAILASLMGGLPPIPVPSPVPAAAKGPAVATDAGAPALPKLSKGQLIAGILADMAAGAAGQPGLFAAAQHQRQRDYLDDVRWHRERVAKREDAMLPRVEKVGDSLGYLDPQAQSYKPFYTSPQPFEQYASAMGYQPGTPDYQRAVQDYRLGAWSAPAVDAKRDLEAVRYGYRDELQDDRLAVTRRGQDIRSADVHRGQDISRGNNIRSNATRQATVTPRKSKGGSDAVAEGTIIRNPSTGKRMQMKGGQWVPIN